MIDNDISGKVKRYSLYSSHVAGGTNFIESTEQLRKNFPQAKVYVEASDYDALQQQLAALELSRRSWMDEAKALEGKASALAIFAMLALPELIDIDAQPGYGHIPYSEGWNDCIGTMLEPLAKQIYDSWSTLPGFTPWAEGGNSPKQDEARAMARSMVSLAKFNQMEQPK